MTAEDPAVEAGECSSNVRHYLEPDSDSDESDPHSEGEFKLMTNADPGSEFGEPFRPPLEATQE